jgi:hypothetical protein
MDLPKFVSILSKQALFFPSADRLGDPFEGSYPAGNIPARRAFYGEEVDSYVARSEFAKRRRLRSTLVNCWHMNAIESAAMWKLYARDNAGIAVRSTYDAFTASFSRVHRPVYVGIVHYLHYETDEMPEENLLAPFVHKRASFDYERELRAVIESQQIISRTGPAAVWPETGEYIPVDVSTLITAVHLAPSSPRWFVDIVRAVSTCFGLVAPIVRSQLDRSPIY